jgi:hypothetical protein
MTALRRPSLAVFFLLLGPLVVQGQKDSTVLRREVIRGRVTNDSLKGVVGATVTATMAPDRLIQRTTTDSAGRYELIFEKGTGDYLLHIAALGKTPFRKRLSRTGTDSIFVVDAKLESPAPQKMADVNVTAEKPKPRREEDQGKGVGGSEKTADGVHAAVPPDQKGNIRTTASTVPGVQLVNGGFSVLGLGAAQNSTTLNGMAFNSGDVPRGVESFTRVYSSSYDPALGWFGGAQVDVQIGPGRLFGHRELSATFDARPLQFATPAAAQAGQRFTNGMIGLGGRGPLTSNDHWLWNYGLQASRRAADLSTLLGAGSDLLRESGLAPDSVARFLQLLSASGIPLSVGGIPSSSTSDNASFIVRLDHAPFDWQTMAPARSAYGFLGYAKWNRVQPLGLGTTSLPANGARSNQTTALLQSFYSFYFGDDYLSDSRTSISINKSNNSPYVRLPNGQVLVASQFTDGTGGLGMLQFGGGGVTSELRDWTWETTSELQLYPRRRSTHRLKVNFDARLDGYSHYTPSNPLGTYSYQSLEDLSDNNPASFSRTIGESRRTGAEWNAFLAAGDLWKVKQGFQLIYGARVEGNRFTSRPAYNPTVEDAFGVRTDVAPNTMHISPRLGFTWLRQQPSQGYMVSNLGSYIVGPSRYLRGGIGEFRSMMRPTLLSDALIATGLPAAAKYLTCVGPATPIPDWEALMSGSASIPSECVGGGSASPFADLSPSVHAFDPSYTAPRSWRGNLGYSSSYRGFVYTVEGIYSLNLNQAGIVDLNFAGAPKFTTADEGRPVFVSPSSIVPSTGALSTVEARREDEFGRVLLHRSDLRSISRQATVTISPTMDNFPNYYTSIAYTLGDVRTIARGFDGSTFGSPTARSWSPGDLDIRHSFLVQFGLELFGFGFSTFTRINSGARFTPIVGGDVNGDGFANDRAFVFDPTDASPAVAQGMQQLLSSAPSNVRDCLRDQLNQAATRNSCIGRWTSSMNMQLTRDIRLPSSERYLNVTLNFSNPLGGLDQLLHGSDKLRGWGTPALPDPILYTVKGFDPATNRYEYEVNPRFGSTRSNLAALAAPFRITLDMSLGIGTPMSEQQLTRFLRPGRGGHPGKRLTVAELKRRYERNVPDPYADVINESDSLLLSSAQIKRLEELQRGFRVKMDSLWLDLSSYLDKLGDHYDAAEAVKRQESAIDSAWEMTRAEIKRTFPTVLSPVQLKLLPGIAGMLYRNNQPKLRIRMFNYG